MATFKKSHSRGKPVVEGASITDGITYSGETRLYTASLCIPGGPPYVYFELQINESEMLSLVAGWSSRFIADYKRNQGAS